LEPDCGIQSILGYSLLFIIIIMRRYCRPTGIFQLLFFLYKIYFCRISKKHPNVYLIAASFYVVGYSFEKRTVIAKKTQIRNSVIADKPRDAFVQYAMA